MSTINEIMDTPPNELRPEDTKALVAYHREARARLDAGVKPKKDRPKVELDISHIIKQIKPASTPDKPKFVRRV